MSEKTSFQVEIGRVSGKLITMTKSRDFWRAEAESQGQEIAKLESEIRSLKESGHGIPVERIRDEVLILELSRRLDIKNKLKIAA